MPISLPDHDAWLVADSDESVPPGLLPLVVSVQGRLCVVVGDGRIAQRKARTLCEHGARVRLVVPPASGLIALDHDAVLAHVEVVRRECLAADLVGARLVVAATNDPNANHRVACLAHELGVLVLQVDAPEDSDFHVPAILRAGELTVAFSTQGASPGFAARLRDEAATFYGLAHAQFCRLARWLRREAIVSVPSEAREQLFERLVQSEALSLLARGERAGATRLAQQLLNDAKAAAATTHSVTHSGGGGGGDGGGGDGGGGKDHDDGTNVDSNERRDRAARAPRLGKVFLVGAGPGDPDLLTVKGARCLSRADTILYDGMVSSELLAACPAEAKKENVSKRKGSCKRTQDEINAMLIDEAKLGRTVVRLKGGDPTVFGRGGEEARALRRAGVPFEIVPGVSSVTAVPAYAGIPVTDRDYSSSFAVYSAHRRGGLGFADDEWERIAHGPDTLVFLMGKTRCDAVARKLVEFGRPETTPVAVIFNGTTAKQRTVVGTLASIVSQTCGVDNPGPGLIVVGDVVNARSAMAWFDEAGGSSRRGA